MKSKVIAVMLSIIMLVVSSAFVKANTTTEGNLISKDIVNNEKKIYSNATIKDDFADDSVIVVFKESASDYNRIFTANDFSEVKCKKVDDLTRFTRESIAEKKAEKVAELEKTRAYSSGKTEISNEEIIKEYNINVENFQNSLCLELEEKGKDKVLEAIKTLEKRDDIIYAGPNYCYSVCDSVIPNDTNYLNGQQWAIDTIQLPEAWAITQGSSAITVGVIDSGIDKTHPEFQGRINESLSQDFYYQTNKNPFYDETGHGTHVAGIIGAEGNNVDGVAGTAWNVKLVSLKIVFKGSDNIGHYYSSDLKEAIDYAENKKIKILNLSGGGYQEYIKDGDYPIRRALNSYSGLFVCSAGNGIDTDGDGYNDTTVNTDTILHYPSSYTHSNLISVTSVNTSNQLPNLRNYGATSVDLAAPGEEILSTVPTSVVSSGYDSWGGTSMAAPYVTGVAALMMSVNQNLTPAQIKSILIATVDKNSNFTNKCVSGGTLNAYKAVLGAKNNYTYTPVTVKGGRFFYTSDTNWFNVSSTRVMGGNINNDARMDFLAFDNAGDICYTLNNGGGTFLNQAKATYGGFTSSWFSSSYNRRIWMADVNADGYDDIIGVSAAGKIYTAINNKNNTFAAPVMRTGTAFVSSSGWFSTNARERVWTGDINGDGRADLMGISTAGHVYYSLANSSGGYSNETKITVTNGFANSWFSKNYNSRIWVADVNADGYDDFIGVSIDGHIYTSINNKNFTFTSATNKGGTAFVSSSAWFSTTHSGRVWPADMNADGRCDIVGISGDGSVYTSTANSNGTYGGEVKNLVIDGTKYDESWFSNTSKSRIFIGFVDRYATPDFIGISQTGYAHVSLQLCKTR